MASKHGQQAWPASMASKHGQQAWIDEAGRPEIHMREEAA
jgi:hypothetical protein